MHNNYLIVEAKTADALRDVQPTHSRKQKEEVLFHVHAYRYEIDAILIDCNTNRKQY